MDIKIFVVFLLMAFLVIFGLISCFSSNESGDKDTVKNTLDWESQPSLTADQWSGVEPEARGSPLEGIYTGSYLTDDGNLLNVRVRLIKEYFFEASYHYADGSYNTIDIKGRFQWDDTRSIIIIDVIDAPIRYKVAKNKLIKLDEYNYVLEKVQ
jgi:hypothetical protein